MTDLPVRSMIVAPSGALTRAASPISAMLPPRTTSVWFSLAAAPVPSITRTLVNATTGASTLMKPRTPAENCAGCALPSTPAARNSRTIRANMAGILQ
jgi:hypothetical protein